MRVAASIFEPKHFHINANSDKVLEFVQWSSHSHNDNINPYASPH